MIRQENASLKPYNTFGIDVSCTIMYRIQDVDDLRQVLAETTTPYLILGGGSNLLFSKDQEVTVLRNEITGIEILSEDEENIFVEVGGGVNWHQLVLWAVSNNFGGLENLSLIPGTVGASPIQNIGAYGVELDQVFSHLRAIRLSDGAEVTFDKDECQFGYRNSIFKQDAKGKYFITHVTYRLTKNDHKINISYAPLAARFEQMPSIKEVSDAVIEIRRSKLPDPEVLGNSGSFFKNPIVPMDVYEKLKNKHSNLPSYPVDTDHVKIPAGWLIEKAGWKGRRIGDAGTYKNQALVLVNHGNATGEEILDFAHLIIDDVFKKFGISLSPEVNVF